MKKNFGHRISITYATVLHSIKSAFTLDYIRKRNNSCSFLSYTIQQQQ